MDKRTMDELISYFNQEVSKMDISKENKMKLLGMITAIGHENKKQEVVRCGECKFSDWYESVDGEQLCYCMEHGSTRHKETDYCNYGEREVQE